jgi:hypothetical protein
VFWVPKVARWSHLQANAKQPTIGKLIDEAMAEIEKANPGLKGVLPKDYNRPALDKVVLGELIDLVSGIGMGEPSDKAKDILGRVYEYFLGGFAGSEGKRGGEFYTPRSVVRVLVEMLEPYKGRVYDPCCGSGGMFVQSEKFVESHGGRIGDIAIYGQESNYTPSALSTHFRQLPRSLRHHVYPPLQFLVQVGDVHLVRDAIGVADAPHIAVPNPVLSRRRTTDMWGSFSACASGLREQAGGI